jgi:energy-converting hydrogenase Eha subunit A
MEKTVKMLGFVMAALSLGVVIAVYLKLPKDDEMKKLVSITKYVIFVMALTLIGLFTLAMVGSTTSFKLF